MGSSRLCVIIFAYGIVKCLLGLLRLFCGYSISIDLVSTQKPEEPFIYFLVIDLGLSLKLPHIFLCYLHSN
jgi:hypothetical protein